MEEKPNFAKNMLGGIYVNDQELKEVMHFIEKSSTGKIQKQNLKKRISSFAKNLTGSDYQFLTAGKESIEPKELQEILNSNELNDYDPVKEAFKWLDPLNTGTVDPQQMKQIFSAVGYGELTEDDLNILMDTFDQDKNGKVTLQDFRSFAPFKR